MNTRGFLYAGCSCVDVYGEDGKLIGSLMADMYQEDQRWFVVVHNWWGERQDTHVDWRIAVSRYKFTHQYRLDPHFDALGFGAYDDPQQALKDVHEAELRHKAGARHARIVE